jgi:DNA-directed RNA polymerase specialized sigma subunit
MAFEFLHRPFELTSEEVSEVEARLHYFGFELRSGEGAKLRAFQSRWEKLQKEIKTRASNTLTLAEARIFHGSDEFDLWNGFREARTLRGRIAWRNAIVVRHLDKIRKGAACAVPLMQRSQDPSMDFEDLFQEGCIGAMWATGTYDITSRCKPGNYLWFGARLTALRFADRVAGNPHVFRKLKIALERLAMKGFIEPTLEDVAREMRISLGRAEQLLMMIGRGLDRHPVSLDVVEAEDPSWDDCLDLLEEYSERDHNLALKTFVQEMLAEASLLPAEREVVEWRFGLRDGQEYTLEAIAEKYGFIRAPHDVSHWPKMRIWRLLTAALQKLRVVASWRRAKTFVSGLRSPDHPITSDTKGGNSH